jgi:MSHA biogenesis protein MshP
MFFKSPHYYHDQPRRAQSQRGSMLVIAIFILTVMMLLAAAMQTVFTSAGQAVTYEVYGVRALSAANAGAERVMEQVFHSLADDAARDHCNDLDGDGDDNTDLIWDFSAQEAFHGCKITPKCDTFQAADFDHFRVISTARCIAGDFVTVRRVAIEGRVAIADDFPFPPPM